MLVVSSYIYPVEKSIKKIYFIIRFFKNFCIYYYFFIKLEYQYKFYKNVTHRGSDFLLLFDFFLFDILIFAFQTVDLIDILLIL